MYSTSVNVFVEDLDKNPYCFHGPSLLFKTISPNVKEYFACSAYRDRKDCSFYLNAADKDDQKQKEGQKKWEAIHQEIICNIHNEKRYDKFLKIMNSLKSTNMIQCTEMDKISLDKIKAFDTYSDLDFNKSKKRKRLKDASKNLDIGYCQTCKVLVKNKNSEHIVCEVVRNLTAHQLMHPTEILKPKENSKAEAQYFFKSEVAEKIVSIILKMNVSRILCIGTPRIHENVLNKLKGKLESMLLDIDQSYYNFYDSKQFIWYNMFNNYMFDKKCHSDLLNFLKTKKLLILMDPPFGGRVEPLANTLKALNKSYVEVNRIKDNGLMKLKVVWFFPYFMEHHITCSLPDFKMFDFKIDYENHSSFTNVGNRKRKHGSPVRIFTNVPLRLFDLSNIPGYKYCQECEFWVAEENLHCKKCNACTSKNGTTYRHCNQCKKCVKPSYQHCDNCSRCCLKSHICGEFTPDLNCYHCHKPGHKKYDCPELKKRKLVENEGKFSKKKKKKTGKNQERMLQKMN